MEDKYLKDFVIALIVIFIILFIIKDMNLYSKVKDVREESKYSEMALGDELLGQIQKIESSIQDRKQFIFTVTKDPLEQNLIVRTIKDLELQWREEVENMIRLESTIVPEKGKTQAVISYKGITKIYQVGDKFAKGVITEIRQGEISYKNDGVTGILKIEKLPEKPAVIQKKSAKNKKSELDYNW
ncbi:MAG: hypothetical protein Q7J16_13285 [Candidatus Cloacimonadales bacterium]|nr:hypothetical protein [Candidatus Cloacimonadales bacterium]